MQILASQGYRPLAFTMGKFERRTGLKNMIHGCRSLTGINNARGSGDRVPHLTFNVDQLVSHPVNDFTKNEHRVPGIRTEQMFCSALLMHPRQTLLSIYSCSRESMQTEGGKNTTAALPDHVDRRRRI